MFVMWGCSECWLQLQVWDLGSSYIGFQILAFNLSFVGVYFLNWDLNPAWDLSPHPLLDPHHWTLHITSYTFHLKPQFCFPRSPIPHPEDLSLNAKPSILNPNFPTINPKPLNLKLNTKNGIVNFTPWTPNLKAEYHLNFMQTAEH